MSPLRFNVKGANNCLLLVESYWSMNKGFPMEKIYYFPEYALSNSASKHGWRNGFSFYVTITTKLPAMNHPPVKVRKSIWSSFTCQSCLHGMKIFIFQIKALIVRFTDCKNYKIHESYQLYKFIFPFSLSQIAFYNFLLLKFLFSFKYLCTPFAVTISFLVFLLFLYCCNFCFYILYVFIVKTSFLIADISFFLFCGVLCWIFFLENSSNLVIFLPY